MTNKHAHTPYLPDYTIIKRSKLLNNPDAKGWAVYAEKNGQRILEYGVSPENYFKNKKTAEVFVELHKNRLATNLEESA